MEDMEILTGHMYDKDMEIERLREALKEVAGCYVRVRSVVGLNNSIPLHRPYEIATAALGYEQEVTTTSEK